MPHAHGEELAKKYKELEEMYTVSTDTLKEITKLFYEELRNGLSENNQMIPMIPTFVFGWPNGDEEGDYLSLDMGGTNIRVCLVQLKGHSKFELTQTKYRITEEQKHQDGQELFDFMAHCIKDFVERQYGSCDNVPQTLTLGFTFSYPTVQEAIDHGELIRWTKGFTNPNTTNRDVADMLRQSLKKTDCPVELSSLINDTTGTLIASNYVDPNTRIACILGTGCNAAYMDSVKNIPKISNLGIDGDELMAINCEYGAFDAPDGKHMASVRNRFDKLIDESSSNKHEQMYEKMISGLYLGEMFRLIVCELIYEGVLFQGQETYKLEKPYKFDTAFLSLIEADPTDELITVLGLFQYFFSIETDIHERRFFKKLAKLIGLRSARLSACGLSALVEKQGSIDHMEELVIGIDGSLYSKYPGFADRLHTALGDILGEKAKKIVTKQAEDGSGAGSAVIAAMTKARKSAGKLVDL